VVNLITVYRSELFRAAVQQHQAQIVGYYEGIGRWGSTQSEVVLDVAAHTESEVFALGGESSGARSLALEAARQLFGPGATEQQVEALLRHAEQVDLQLGARWLTMEGTQHVLARTRPVAQKLVAVKKARE
jgi:hypothetical protein